MLILFMLLSMAFHQENSTKCHFGCLGIQHFRFQEDEIQAKSPIPILELIASTPGTWDL